MGGIYIYPNPANNYLYIDPCNLQNYEVHIYSADGTILNKSEFDKSTRQQIDISDLPKGVYFIKISVRQSHFHTQKFIKK